MSSPPPLASSPAREPFLLSPFAALHGLRVGCVQYLNAKPLIVPYEGEVIFEHPAKLADDLAAGEVDVALVPVFEALRQADFPVVDGVAISSSGPVYSVVLAYRGPLKEIRSVTLDPASRTSNNLLRCMLAEFHGLRPEYKPAGAPCGEIGDHEGLLLIGNQAIRHREEPHEGVMYLDFGEEWLAQTGLPFVYAVWQIRAEIPEPGKVADALRAIKCAGVCRAREIGRLQRDFDPAFAEHYLTHHIKFDLGAAEKAGLTRFRELLGKHGLIPRAEPVSLHFV
jgi:chorismate dehydratase